MKSCIKGMLAVVALSLTCSAYAGECDCNLMKGMDNPGGKTVGWLGDTGGKVTNGVAKLYGDIMYTTFNTTDKLLNHGCDKCDK